jgi:hypothetical protein
MSGDGRLDLDDLGQVVENATPLGAAPDRDELGGGSEGPTWSERLTPVRGWLHRRRPVVAVATAVALALGVGAAAWTRGQPPPPATELAVGLSFDPDRAGVEFLDDSVLRIGVRADARRPGETVRVLGLAGTGIAASRATSTAPGDFDVSAVIDCGLEPTLVTGTAATEHLIEVESTDAYGRTLRGRLPMIGVTDSLGFSLSQHCAQIITDRGILPTVTSARRDGDGLALTVSVRNDTAHRVLLTVPPMMGTVDVTAPDVGVPAGRSRFWDVRLSVTDCARPQLPWVAPDGTWIEIAGTDLLTDPAALGTDVEPVIDAQASFLGGPDADGALSSMYQGPSSRQIRLGAVWPEMRGWVRDVCGGAAPATASVRPAGIAIPAPSAEDPSRLALPVDVRLVLPGGAVRVAEPAPGPYSSPEPRLVAARDPGRGWSLATNGPGQVTARLWWLVSCTGDLSPPTLAVEVRDGVRTTPWRIALDDGALADALAVACPVEAAGADVLAGWGWDSLGEGGPLPRG